MRGAWDSPLLHHLPSIHFFGLSTCSCDQTFLRHWWKYFAITGTFQPPDQNALIAAKCPEDHIPHVPFPAHDHPLNTYWPPSMIMCSLPTLLHVAWILSQWNSRCPSCGQTNQLLRFELTTSPGCWHPTYITPFLFSKFSLELLASLVRSPSKCVGQQCWQAQPGDYALDLSRPLRISWDREVGHSSAQGSSICFWVSCFDRLVCDTCNKCR